MINSSRAKDSPNKKTIKAIKETSRKTYDRGTLNELSEEVKFAEIALSEIKKFICILYGTLVRFYLPVSKF